MLKGDSLEDSFLFLPRERGFKLASLNITSLPKHIDELRILLADRYIDILAINETRLDDSILDRKVHILGYDIIRWDRNRNGGGVCFYVRSTISTIHCVLICVLINWKMYVLRYENPAPSLL